MNIRKDYFENPIVPDFVLCKANKGRVGIIQCTEKCIDYKFNNLNEINFTTYLYTDGEINPYYEAIEVMKFILVPSTGFFVISQCEINSEGTDYEYKKIIAKSSECLFVQKYLENFVINMGTVNSIDGVQFYNLKNKNKSLIHLILEKYPDWEIGHIDTSLQTIQRSFEINRQDVYSFLMTDVAEAFECFFEFDTLTNTINIYKEKNISKDTNIHISYVNLLKNTDMVCSVDNIKTCLTITGSDDLTIREINMGYDKIYNFSYYNSIDFMSHKLYDAYNKWLVLRKSKLSDYTLLLSQYQDYCKQINYNTYNKIPSVENSTDWTQYGLEPLKEQLELYKQKQALSMKAGHGNIESNFYKSEYLPIYNTIQNINTQIEVLERQIKSLQDQQSIISIQMSKIIDTVSMSNNFTIEELAELSTFIREEELSSTNYIVTDVMTDEERFEMLKELLEFGENELARIATPQLTFNADMVNLFEIPEFEPFYDNFEPGNYIWVTLRDNFSIKAKLLSVHLNFYDPTDFSVTFGNISRKTKTRYSDSKDIIKAAAEAATTVSFNSSHWNQSAKDTSIIGKILDEGLIAAGKYLKNGDDSEMVIDKRGIFINTISGDYAYKDSIFIGGGRILFTDDDWKTVSMSVGRANVTINGVTESRFGTFADFVIAGYIGSSILEGSEIFGGVLKSTNYVSGKLGTLINLNNGTFEFNANNEPKLTLINDILTVKGTIQADLGYIGGINGFTIMSGKLYSMKDSLISNANGVYIGTDGIALGANNKFKALPDGTFYAEKGYLGGENGFVLATSKIYNGKSSVSDASNGVYIGTDGIALGANSAFNVTLQGHLTSKSGTIGGAIITENSIHSSNNNWWIASDGSASFKNVFVSGVQAGSNFGGLNYNNGVTSGNFSGDSYYGSSIQDPFSGTTIPHIQTIAADYIRVNYLEAINADITTLYAQDAQISNLVATKASIDQLDATNARVGNIEADYVSISSLNATNARIETLETTTITSEKVYSDFMEVKKWVSAGYIRADKINADTIVAKIGEYSGIVSVPRLFVTEAIDAHLLRISTLQLGIASGAQLTSSCHWSTIMIDGDSYTVLCQ